MSDQTETFQLLCAAGNLLGEGIRYDLATETLDWVDVAGKSLHSMTIGGRHLKQEIGLEPGFAVRMGDGSLLVGAEDRLVLRAGAVERSVRIDGIHSDTALNDGAVHPDGTCFVFGTRHRDESEPKGGMWIVGNTIQHLPLAFTVFNGPAFSPSGDRLYFADSPEGIIWTAQFDRQTLSLGECSVFARVRPADGFPDGMTIDDQGCVWSAHWDGWRITRYRPDGTVERTFETPVPRPTSVAFAGTQRRLLVVTSAAPYAAASQESANDFRDGDVFALDVGVTGPGSPRLRADQIMTLFQEHA